VSYIGRLEFGVEFERTGCDEVIDRVNAAVTSQKGPCEFARFVGQFSGDIEPPKQTQQLKSRTLFLTPHASQNLRANDDCTPKLDAIAYTAEEQISSLHGSAQVIYDN
jgi:hypothetical protein